MPLSSRFAVSVHVLTLLACCERELLNSELIARSVNTNPVVIRRILSLLRKAGLVVAATGQGGGFTLAKPAGDITLLDVFRAVEQSELMRIHSDPNAACPVGRQIETILEEVHSRALSAVEKEMANVSVGSLVTRVKREQKRTAS